MKPFCTAVAVALALVCSQAHAREYTTLSTPKPLSVVGVEIPYQCGLYFKQGVREALQVPMVRLTILLSLYTAKLFSWNEWEEVERRAKNACNPD